MRILMLALLGAVIGAGCASLPPELQIGHEPAMVTLAETAEALGLSIEETDYWGERVLVNTAGDRVLIRRECKMYWFNGLSRTVEYPGVKSNGSEFRFPLGMYNGICKDFGRLDMLRDQMPRYTEDQRPEAVRNYRPPLAVQKSAQPENANSVEPAGGSLSGMIVVIDPGHGGKDPGAIGINGVYEKDVTLAVGKLVRDNLVAKGASVIMTRSEDTYPTLSERVDLANGKKADIFVSIHANSAENAEASGIETWYHAGGTRGELSQALARDVEAAMIATTDAQDRGIRGANFHVIKNTSMPAILIELGFLSNRGEAQNLANATYQKKLAQAITRGVEVNVGRKVSISR